MAITSALHPDRNNTITVFSTVHRSADCNKEHNPRRKSNKDAVEVNNESEDSHNITQRNTNIKASGYIFRYTLCKKNKWHGRFQDARSGVVPGDERMTAGVTTARLSAPR